MAVDEQQRAAYRTATEWNFDHPVGTPVLAWPGVREGAALLRTRTRSLAWALPAGDIVVSVDGHGGGIALTHIDDDPTRQPAVPDIEFEEPPCPICGTELNVDGDSFTCDPCGASWSMNGTGGRWDDPAAPRCLATVNPFPTTDPDVVRECTLAQDHDLEDAGDKHRTADGLTSWTDYVKGALTDTNGAAL